jgi:hypothetical protein
MTRENAAGMHPGDQGAYCNAGFIPVFALKQDSNRFFNYLLDLCPFTSLHIIYILGNFACMVTTPFKIPGDKDVVGTAGDAFRIFHHVGNCLAEDRAP